MLLALQKCDVMLVFWYTVYADYLSVGKLANFYDSEGEGGRGGSSPLLPCSDRLFVRPWTTIDLFFVIFLIDKYTIF